MAEVINKKFTKEMKKSNDAIHHYINEKSCQDETGKNYIRCLVSLTTFVQPNSKRFPLSLIDQRNRGVKSSDVEFVTEEAVVCYFQEIIRNLTCMSATAKQHQQAMQAWLHFFEPKWSFDLTKLADVERSIKLQNKP